MALASCFVAGAGRTIPVTLSDALGPNQPLRAAPLCQGVAAGTFLRDVFGLVQEARRQEGVGVADLDADEAFGLPVEGDG